MQAHLHMRSYARLSTAGPFKRHSANSLRTEHQCDCSARKLALGRTYTGRSFLEEEQHHRAFTESKRLTHLPLTFNKNLTFGDNIRDQAFLDSEASKNPATNEPAFFRASKTMTLNVLILRWMNSVDFCFCCFPLRFYFVCFRARETCFFFFGGYTMEMAYKEETAER
jgi:hypothetical protein